MTGLTDAQVEAIRVVAVADAVDFYGEYKQACNVDRDHHIKWVHDAWYLGHCWVRALGAFASNRERCAGVLVYSKVIEAETALLALAR